MVKKQIYEMNKVLDSLKTIYNERKFGDDEEVAEQIKKYEEIIAKGDKVIYTDESNVMGITCSDDKINRAIITKFEVRPNKSPVLDYRVLPSKEEKIDENTVVKYGDASVKVNVNYLSNILKIAKNINEGLIIKTNGTYPLTIEATHNETKTTFTFILAPRCDYD